MDDQPATPSIGETRMRQIGAGRGFFSRYLADYLGMAVVFLVILLLFGLMSEHFLTRSTFNTLANRIPTLTVIAVGMTYVLIIAGIDLSVGSVMAFSGAVLGWVMVDLGGNIWAGAGAAVVAGFACGLVNGTIAVRWTIPSFIVTLGMLEMARGASYWVTGSKTKYIGRSIEGIGAPLGEWGVSAAFLVALAAVGIGQAVLSRTIFGRYIVAIGTNEEAVRLSGIDPRPIKATVFALSGTLAGAGAIFHSSRLASADPNAGVGLELAAIAAVVIGGTSLMGGRGSVINSFFGVLIIATLEAGLAQIGASEPTKRIITGAVIIVAVVADAYRSRSGHLWLARVWFRRG